MFCIHCGAANPEDASFCSICGKAIGGPANPPTPAEPPQQMVGGVPKSPENATGQALPPITMSVQPTPQPQAQYLRATPGKGKPVLWILVGFAACLLIVIGVTFFRGNQNSSGQEPARDNAVSESTPTAAPATYTPPPTALQQTVRLPQKQRTRLRPRVLPFNHLRHPLPPFRKIRSSAIGRQLRSSAAVSVCTWAPTADTF